jgi:hypothetical protein
MGKMKFTRADCFALVISLLAILAAIQVTDRAFERIAHLEDEYAYVWQAQAIARGHLTLPTPDLPKSFLVPFVVDYNGQRFGKYPLGWPVVLSLGERFGIRHLVNPLLAGLAVWLTYRLGKKLLGETVGLLAAGLTLTSPFFLVNAGSLLSHPWGLVLSTAFALSWLDAVGEGESGGSWLPTVTAGFTLGVLGLSRPYTMVGVALPFAIHGLILMVRGGAGLRRRVLTIGVIALLISGLHFLWQYAATGNPFMNPYTLWWEYDKLGFGPGYGVTPQGHNLRLARHNTKFGLQVGLSDLFGWGKLSWIFLPFGVWAVRRKRKLWLVASVFPVLVILYLAYWVGAWLFGPRYYYEGLYSLTILSAAGIAWLAGWPLDTTDKWPNFTGLQRLRPLGVTALLALLVTANLVFYTPSRIQGMQGLYSIEAEQLKPLLSPEAEALTPAVILVHADRWMGYGVYLALETPFLDTPFIFAWSHGPRSDQAVIDSYPDRAAYHYYPDEPYRFYTGERP